MNIATRLRFYNVLRNLGLGTNIAWRIAFYNY
jgi:hypothetical protein